MSMFNKLLASFGIGGAKVDTKLEKETYQAGETIEGQVEVFGGQTAQHIDAIYLAVRTNYIREIDDHSYRKNISLIEKRLNEPFTIEAGGQKVIPFSIELPFETPVSYGDSQVWVETGLEIKNALDPEDKDYLIVQPSRIVSSVLDAIEDLGFTLRKAVCEEAPMAFRGRFPFVQEFEYVPISKAFRGSLDEVELVFLQQTDASVEVFMEIDRRARHLGGLLAEAFDLDESKIRFTIHEHEYPHIAKKLEQLLIQHR